MSRTGIFRFELKKTNDKGDLQLGKGYGYAGEEVDGHHIVRQHGFASNAPKGSHGIGVTGSGERPTVAVLGLEHEKHRQRDLPEGQARVYDDKGNVIRMQGADGIWHDAGDRAQKMTGKTLEHKATGDASFGGGGKTYIGGNGKDGSYAAVMTASGPSSSVFCKL